MLPPATARSGEVAISGAQSTATYQRVGSNAKNRRPSDLEVSVERFDQSAGGLGIERKVPRVDQQDRVALRAQMHGICPEPVARIGLAAVA